MARNFGIWWNKRYHLNKMSLGELVTAYFGYYAIQAYLVIAAACGYLVYRYAADWTAIGAVVLITLLVYPLVWYLLHRYVLHGRYLFKSPLTARTWKRIHFDHHQDPHDLRVLFGALYTTLPTIAVVTGTIGWLFHGVAGAAAGIGTGCLVTCFYEFCHCIQHLAYKPKSAFLRRIKQRHMEHHFLDERGNYGITNFFWDRILGTHYTREDRGERSPTVFNLGYDDDTAEDYPWVKDLSGGIITDDPRLRRQQMSSG